MIRRVRIALVALAIGFLFAVMFVNERQQESRLLRTDPNDLSDARLMSYARHQGESLFRKHCADCHGYTGAGDSARGIPDLRDSDWLYGAGSVSDIEQVIRYGIRSYHPRSWNLAIMPAYASAQPSANDPRIPSLSPDNIRDVVEFLIQKRGQTADAAGAARGAALFEGPAGCYDCHSVDARGDSAIGAPNLTDEITLYGDGSRGALTISIEFGRHGMCPAWEARTTAAAIRELAIYVTSLSRRAAGQVE